MKLYLILFVMLLAGCTAGIPKHHFVALDDSINKSIVCNMINQYNNRVLEKADILSSITFRFRGRSMTALGVTKLDGINKSFSVAVINPMAVTLFKLKILKGKLVSYYVMPQFGRGKDSLNQAARAIGSDIAHIYFERKVNPCTKTIKFDRYKVVVTRKARDYTLDVQDPREQQPLASVEDDRQSNGYLLSYVFIGNPLRLAEKSQYKDGVKLWSIDYYNYEKAGLKEMPSKIFLKNYKYGYTLDVETKQIRELKDVR